MVRNSECVDKDYRYDVYDENNYLIDDNYVSLEAAIDYAMDFEGIIIRKAWYYLDENDSVDFDRHVEDEDVWTKSGWVFDGEKFIYERPMRGRSKP